METLPWNIFRQFFSIFCTIIVIFMVSFWMYKYSLVDRSIGVVDYEVLEKIDDELPQLSMCFMDPFLRKKLQDIDQNITSTIYLRYLSGEYYDDNLAAIDYDNVTIDLDKYFKYAEVKLRNESKFLPKKMYPKHNVVFDGIYHERFSKCFAANIKKNEIPNIEHIRFFYDSTQLMKDMSGPRYAGRYQVPINFFYPGQFLLEFTNPHYEDIGLTRQWSTELTITSIEYLRRRNSRHHKCMTEWKHFDDIVRSEHLQRIGCKAPYGRSHEPMKKCASPDDIKRSTIYHSNIWKKYFPKACNRISKISVENTQFRSSMRIFQIDIKYPDDVKTITQSQEVDGHTLIGNIGGYIGLFLGCAIIEIPNMIYRFYMLFKKRAKKTNTSDFNLSLINDKESKHGVGLPIYNDSDTMLYLEENRQRIKKLEREFKKLYNKRSLSHRY